jgi:hypothetical protein
LVLNGYSVQSFVTNSLPSVATLITKKFATDYNLLN